MRPTTSARARTAHPATPTSALRLYGRRVMLRALVGDDFEMFSEVRTRNGAWLTDWEPIRPSAMADPAVNFESFSRRCELRDRERGAGNAYTFGVFVDSVLCGEINLNGVSRGSMQSATIGYWIDRARAGHGYVPEAVVVLTRYAFEQLRLHRLEICIIPRNENSLRVVQKLAWRHEGRAERFLEINGVWEDHDRFGFTSEEWEARAEELSRAWL
ncbi:MAG: GNAT family N-acetyltransferase [Actinomycetota bacterium]